MLRGRRPFNWTAAATFSKEEQRAAHSIEGLGFQYYLPFMRVEENDSGLRRLMFPGYIFIQLRAGWEQLIHLPGIRKFFLFEEKPIPVPRKDIDTLKAMEGKDGLIKVPDRLQCGTLVRIRDGFNSLSGQTCRVIMTRAHGQCEVSLSLGRVVLDSAALDVVAEA